MHKHSRAKSLPSCLLVLDCHLSPQPRERNHCPAPANTNTARWPAKTLPAHLPEEPSGSLQLPPPCCRWEAAAHIGLQAQDSLEGCWWALVLCCHSAGLTISLCVAWPPQPPTLQVFGAHLGASWRSEAFGASRFLHSGSSMDCRRNSKGSHPERLLG